jgi:hypothetical protein
MTTVRKEPRRYVYVFGMTLSISLVVMLAAAIYIQPLEGELTRLGSYAERDFGWNLPQKKVRGHANMASAYEERYDVLVVGDSFSTNGVWQPFFRQKTGLSYVTLNIRKTSFHDLLISQPFRNYPPKVMIVQSVERELLYFFKELDFTCDNERHDAFQVSLSAFTEDAGMESYEEARNAMDLRNINFRYAASVIVNGILRSISGMNSKSTMRFGLSKDTLFSNRRVHEILVFRGDMDKFTWRQEDISRAACSIRGLQDRVQANGKTLFIFMLAPDKSTAYADYIDSSVFRNRVDAQQWLFDYGINTPRIDLLLKEAINREEKDIYIPSGTHWSARGHKLAAKGLADFIRQRVTMPNKSS